MTTPDPAHPNGSNRVYKLVLTGGPCGGKTTGQDRLATFFEQLGWKVFTVPETATILLGGGVKFAELSPEQAYEFQKDLLLTLIKIEDVFFHQAELIKDKNVLVICDRGAMDPSAYMDATSWDQLLKDSSLIVNDIRERRYDQVSHFAFYLIFKCLFRYLYICFILYTYFVIFIQIVHMVSAADGAQNYYTLSNNATRQEGLNQAVAQDRQTRTVSVLCLERTVEMRIF